jgi:hypothetical protein
VHGTQEHADADDGIIPQKQPPSRSPRDAESVLVVSECPGPVVSATESRSGPGPSAREQGTRVPPLAVMSSAVKHSARHVGRPGPGSMSPRRKPPELSASSALSVSTLPTIGGNGYGRHKCDDRRPRSLRSAVSFFRRQGAQPCQSWSQHSLVGVG